MLAAFCAALRDYRAVEFGVSPHRAPFMSTLEPNTPFEGTTDLILGYLAGEVPLASVVAAIRALPPGTSADFAFGLEGEAVPPDLQARVDELWAALSESDRAV
jgi:hypothetical protein